jgi:hypothetical protein
MILASRRVRASRTDLKPNWRMAAAAWALLASLSSTKIQLLSERERAGAA